jgi:hypothetical protein
VKNKTCLAKKLVELMSQQICDNAIFELATRARETQIGWRDTSEYMRRYRFMGKLNPGKFSQILQEMNKYLEFIPMGKNTGKENIPLVKADEKSLPDDEIGYIMGRDIPPEWTVNLLALGKEP